MSTIQRKRRTTGSTGSRRTTKRSRATNTLSHRALDSMLHNEDVVDLTCEVSEPAVVDLTSNDSVVLVDDVPRVRRGQGGESYVLSSDEEEVVNVGSSAAFLSSLEANSAARATPGTISCPVCLDTYGEIVGSGRLVVSTRCGHLFCSQCLRDSLAKSHACPTCRKKLTHKQYHPIYI
ncbi:RING finger protein 4 [Megalops cyprinoides]|uniref:RING finger protein 4 n=1 Tax=Megalops cyprinoides TaxID=118141 RepID=UPI0018650421|nr:RING finger protein 4 [Megalops cyprinoides]XP_036407330.1 RING finger protein 4 [Megalops cyprinoides]XP_036407331.1 RING finger protein 4 [Megalops cyprinoides]